MIVNLRGTNGSGKSYVIRQLMKKYSAVPIMHTNRVTKTLLGPRLDESIIGYHLEKPNIRVVGPYTSACGGCDRIKTQEEVEQRVLEFHALGHVIFEGVIISTIIHRWIKFSKQNGGMLWAFMDTPVEVCIQRVQSRNDGDETVNNDLILGKWNRMKRIAQVAQEEGEHVVWLDHRKPIGSLLKAMQL